MYYYIHFTLINPAGNPNSHFEGDSTTKTFSLFNGSEAVVHYHDVDPEVSYTLLEPGTLRVGEVVRNPALANFEDCFLDERELAEHVFPPVRRYLLHNTVKGKRYEIHISYPGSPPLGFHLLLYHVRASAVSLAGASRSPRSELSKGPLSSFGSESGSHILLDTEVRMIMMDHTRPNQYGSHQTIHYDAKDLERLGKEDNNNDNNIVQFLSEAQQGGLEEDPFIAVVEVRPYVLALSSKSPCLFPEMRYNIQLENLTGNLLPMTIIPIIVGITMIMMLTSALLWFVYHKGFLITSPENQEYMYEAKMD
ncbi:unnamed protein product [Phytomonas sp. EM1]|nr:unnamed protein product [Phytomonas sp. EM1]|eukprot:CCW64979.1 unnamed protein product [Phytomonas sp. isolate EM1]